MKNSIQFWFCLSQSNKPKHFDTSCVFTTYALKIVTAAELKGVKWSILLKAYDFWLPKGLKNAKYLSLTHSVSAAHNGSFGIIKMQQKGVKIVISVSLNAKTLYFWQIFEWSPPKYSICWRNLVWPITFANIFCTFLVQMTHFCSSFSKLDLMRWWWWSAAKSLNRVCIVVIFWLARWS